jgi:hypothetical protein
MIIAVDTYVPFPRALTYATFRDKLLDIAPYMPNVSSIQLTSRQDGDTTVDCVYECLGGGDIPALIKAFLNEEMLGWTEYDTWNLSDLTLNWQIKTYAFTEAVYCAGTNRFLEQGSTTLVESRGELAIDASKIEGVPSFLANQVTSIVTEFLGKKIELNLQQMSEGVCQYLKQVAVDDQIPT